MAGESTSTVSSEDGQEEYMSMNPIADGSYLSGGRGGEEEEESGDEYVPPIEFLAGDVTQDVTDDVCDECSVWMCVDEWCVCVWISCECLLVCVFII